MKLRNLIPMLETNDLKKTISFYESVLGFNCREMHPNEEEPYWASMSRDSVIIMLVTRSPHSKLERATMTGSLYLYPDNVDEAWAELKDKVEISYPIETFDYGMKEFGVLDCNGYLLQFGQSVEELKE